MAKLAIESGPSGLIVFTSPPGIPQWDFENKAANLDVDIPQLFLPAENDPVVSAAEPKEWQVYPAAAHGTDLSVRDNGEEVKMKILQFILATASGN